MADTHENGAEAPTNQPSATGDNVRSTAIPEVPGVQRNPPSRTFFGLNKNQLHSWGVGAAPRNYKARYPLDPYGQEMSENARIWPIYLEEAADFDANMLAEWRDTIDVLLVFAGLFSAVLTTFVVQTSQNMQPDYNQASGFLFFQILNATMSNGSQFSIPSSPTAFNFSPSRSDEWLNSLWFVSLTLSLITALVAVLVKQWLHQYVSIVSDSSARDRARIRHLRYAGLQTWQVPMIIGLLPVLLHVSLALFFAGLAVFLFSLGMKVAWLVSIIGAVTYMAYVVALILPLVHPYCPYKVPLAVYIYHLYRFFYDHLITPILIIRRYPHNYKIFLRNYLHNKNSPIRHAISPLQCPTLKEIERDHVQKYAAKVDAQSLYWLHSSTSNASVHLIVVHACSGMSSTTWKCLPDEGRSAFVVSLHQQIRQIGPLVPSPGTERELELCCRAYVLLHSSYGLFLDLEHVVDSCSNEQLKIVLYSMTSPEKATTALLGILQGPQRSSLTLHSAVWKALVGIVVSFSFRYVGAISELKLEFMKIIASPGLCSSESGEVTTIDKPTDEMRGHIFNLLFPSDNHFQMSATTSSLELDQRIILTFIPRMQQRLCYLAPASHRKHLIETSLTIIECTSLLLRTLAKKHSNIGPVLDALYTLLSSDAFAVVGPDLQPLAHRILIIIDRYQYWMNNILPNTRFYSVAYQCYLHSPAGGGERSENNVMLHILGRLISSWNPPSMQDSKSHESFLTSPSCYSSPASSMSDFDSHDSDSQETPLDPLRYPSHFLVNGIFWVMLLLIKEHNESVLYEWARHPAMQNVWPECLSRLVRWASGVDFLRWDLLKRVLAIIVIGELQNILDHSDDNESLPQYDYDAYTDVDKLPWLVEVAGSSSDREPNALKYSQIAKHPKFQEFLHPPRHHKKTQLTNKRRGVRHYETRIGIRTIEGDHFEHVLKQEWRGFAEPIVDTTSQ